MVMAGSVFASCADSPADTVIKTTTSGNSGSVFTYKTYYGSASARNKGANVHVEGRIVELPCNGMTYAEKLVEITQSLQSAVSYAGGNLNTGVECGIINR
jgi:GMP reductase